MLNAVKTQTMLHICTGCYGQAIGYMPPERGIDILMLPDFLLKAMKTGGKNGPGNGMKS